MAPTLVIRATGDTIGRAGPALLDIWIFFNLVVNGILLPLLVATFIFSPRVKRHPTLVNLCITWIFSGEFSLLLFYAGQHTGPEPNKVLCIVQTTLLYGITPMWSVAVLMLFYYMLKAVSGDLTKKNFTWQRSLFMLSAPYAAQIAFSIAAFTISWIHPEKVTRAHKFFYCALEFHKLSYAMGIFTSLMCIGIVVLEVHIGVIAYRNYRGLRNAGQFVNGIDLQFFLRVMFFGAYIAFGIVVNFISLFAPSSSVPDVFAATAGTVVFLVFGTQPDILNVWCFWRNSKFFNRSYSRHVSTDSLPIHVDLLVTEDMYETDRSKGSELFKPANFGFENHLPVLLPAKLKPVRREDVPSVIASSMPPPYSTRNET